MDKREQISNTTIYTLDYLAPFYSIPLNEFNEVLGFNNTSINKVRAIAVILHHIKKYPSTIQTKLIKIYNLNWRTVKPVVMLLIEKGFIKGYDVSRKTNIDAYVPLTAYSITVAGKEVLNRVEALLSSKVSKVKKTKR